MSGHGSFQVIEAKVSPLEASPAMPRRRWSAVAKEEIVARAMVPGVNVSMLARAHGLSPSQVFGWRRKALANIRTRSGAPAFAVVAVEAAEGSNEGSAVELLIGEVTVRIGPSVPPTRITEVVRAVRTA